MDKLNFVDESLDIQMDWHKILDRFNAKEIGFTDIIRNEYDAEITYKLVAKAQYEKDASEVMKVLEEQSLYTFGIGEQEDVSLISQTLNGYPDEVLLFGVSESMENAMNNKCMRFIFDGDFYYIPNSNTFMPEEIALALVSTLLTDANDHRWVLFSDGIIESANNEDTDPKYFNHPTVDERNQVLCPICNSKMYYAD